MTEEFKLGDSKNALSGIYNQAVLLRSTAELSKILLMLLRRRAEDKQVIYVGNYVIYASSYFVDEALKRLCGISQPKVHSYALKQAEWWYDGGLRYVRRLHPDLMVGFNQINLGKHPSRGQIRSDVMDMWKCVPM